MRRPHLLICLAVVAALTAASGCGSSGDSSTDSSSNPQAGASSAPSSAVARVERSPAAHGREPGGSGRPAAGVCSRTSTPLVTVVLHADVPAPRCVEVTPSQRLQLINRTGAGGLPPTTATVRFAGFRATIEPNHAAVLDQPFGTYLRPGSHAVEVSGAAGPVSLLLR
jgi:hypothetical protein